MKVLALVVLGAAACTGTNAPHARAQRIGTLEETIGGPHAIGRVGDFLLENDQVRFVISDKGFGRVNTSFGGSLVDADLQRPGGDARGNDELAELLPGFLFSVIDPIDVCVANLAGTDCPKPGEPQMDGEDGRPAGVLVKGNPGDLFRTVAALNSALVYAEILDFRQLYKLEPGKRYVTIETTVHNKSTGAHPFPYLDPTQLDQLLGRDIPGIGGIQLSVPFGQLPLLGGEQKLFAPGVAGFNVRFAIEDSYLTAKGFPAFPGLVVDYIASRGPGVSYGLTIPKSDDNFVNAYKTLYDNQDVSPYSMLLPFTYAGVTAAYMYRAPAVLEANEERTYTSYFVVGRGDVASVYDSILELRGETTGTFGGRVVDEQSAAAVPHANVIILKNKQPIDQIETDAGGNFRAQLPPGPYQYVVQTDDRVLAPATSFVVTAGEQTGMLIQVDPPATLAVSVIDELGRHAPVKVQLLGHFPAANKGKDPRTFLYSLTLGERVRPTAYDGGDRYLENAWWTTDGRVLAKVRPGTYDLIITRGPEYEITQKTIVLEAGKFSDQQLVLQRAYSTPGWVAGDFHIHAQPSTDSGLPIEERVASCAAEGLEVAVATDHNYITDYAPVIAATGLDQWLLGISGMELTTFEMGHFNGYPLRIDPGSTRGGEFQWQKKPPGELFQTLRDLAIDPNNSIVQVNHPRQQVLGYFAQFFVDPATAEPYTPTGIMGIFAPYGEEFSPAAYSYKFDALELLTGRRVEDIHNYRAPNPLPPGPFPDPQPVAGQVIVGKDGRPVYPGTVETWMTMLDRGHKATGMGTSDSHHLLGDEPGYARTLLYVGDGKDTPGGTSRDDVIAAIKNHHAITTNAPFIDMMIDGHRIGDTIENHDATVNVVIEVKAPTWAAVDHIVVYMNSAVVLDQPIAAPGTDFKMTVPVHPTRDSWVVAEVTGSSNMFPVLTPTEFPPLDATIIISALSTGLDLSSLPLAAKLKPQRLHFSTPYAITNPIWIDADGGGWTPPKPPLPAKITAPPARPDVRAQFEALPEVSP
jgi:hypothetical protein